MLLQVTKTVPTTSSGTGGVSREPFSSRLLQQPFLPVANLPHRPHPLLTTPMRRRIPAGVRAEGRWVRTRRFRVQMRHTPRSRIPPRWEAGPTMGGSSYSGAQQQGGKVRLPDIGIGGGGGITASERLPVDNVGVVGMGRYARPGDGEATGTGHGRLLGEAAAMGHRNRGVVERMPPSSSRAHVRGNRRDGREAHHTFHLSGERSRTSAVETNNIGTYSVIRSAKFIAREHWLAIGDDDGWVHIYTYTTTTTTTTETITTDKVKEFEAHRGHTVDSLAVHPTDRFLLTASFIDSSIKLWDWGQGWKRLRTFNVPYEQVDSLTWNLRAANTFVSVSRYDISLLSAQQNDIPQVVSPRNSYISQVCLFAYRLQIVLGSSLFICLTIYINQGLVTRSLIHPH